MTNANYRVLIIDDHKLFADGLKLILHSAQEIAEVDIASDAFVLLSDKEKLLSYDLVLIDLHMPRFSGFGFLTALKTQSLPVNVAVISGTEKKSEIERAILLGARGFIPKDSESVELNQAVAQLLSGKRYLPQQWLGEIDWLPPETKETVKSHPLTVRQLQVLELMRDGMQNKQIALILGVSTSSVKGHIELLFKNLNVNNRTACVQAAREARLI
ncbi:response regulator [Arenicella xantha]|uniref:LuxR family two component transcriptional regulator n=1 Tax=Arenicella xantha TaxID=644221 RepID=A0A395JQ40_9GAMM|nr:response regulator transcription factor [Arenicella xantha]RBP53780.1 LuxR family two component transcriptional regulator [Arenicella xantha]